MKKKYVWTKTMTLGLIFIVIVTLAVGLIVQNSYLVLTHSYKYCSKDYEGTILEVITPQGRSASYFFVVDWDSVGVESVLVSQEDYVMHKKGSRFISRKSTGLFGGISGIAALPRDSKYYAAFNPFRSIVHFFTVLAIVGGGFLFTVYRFFKWASKE